MKMNNLFSKTGSLLLAGALAFTFSSCDTDTRSNQSIVREAENQYETETNEQIDVNDPDTDVAYDGMRDEGVYEYNNEYSYEERDVVIDRVRNDLDRTERSLEQLGQRLEQEGAQLSEDARREWDETRKKLELKRDELNQDLENLERSTEDEWENVRNDANETLLGLKQEWEELRNRGIEEIEENDLETPNNTKNIDENLARPEQGTENEEDIVVEQE